jgi:hypothetical protein
LKIQRKTIVETREKSEIITALRLAFPIVPDFPFPLGTIVKILDTEGMPPSLVGNLGIVEGLNPEQPSVASVGTFDEDGDAVTMFLSGHDVERVLVTV